MSQTRVQALVKPELIRWARHSAGFDVAEAAKKAQVAPGRLEAWEEGTQRPTVKQLRRLGNAYRRPLALFYLPDPPVDFKPMHDFRRLPTGGEHPLSAALMFEIRAAQQRRELALELAGMLAIEPETPSLRISFGTDPEVHGPAVRAYLGVTDTEQGNWRSPYEAFNAWRQRLESRGVLVFQATGIDVAEMRGFSIDQSPFPAIVLNIKDSPRARCFTLVHEFVHIMLGAGGLCDLQVASGPPSHDERVEVFCNHVAGATLVPRESLLVHPVVAGKTRHHEWSDAEVDTLAKRYGVSHEVVLRRLLIMGLTTDGFYRHKREELQEQYAAYRRAANEGYAPPHMLALARAGRRFTRLVLENYARDTITASDVSDMLTLRLKHLEKVEMEIRSWS
ncbi:MAG: ImmA/IrrE family metallo-endopeptidase [Acidobacteria bacterium]|nr:ImmA/IrrE family metallo-endopeptidase [Planctomycetota bacterium]MBE3132195.1 ImmA/IrrE family metallo-endopeptidase [Acidobacteriota bacterium]